MKRSLLFMIPFCLTSCAFATNVALNASASASAEQTTLPIHALAANAVDGDIYSCWGVADYAAPDKTYWLKIDLGTSFNIQQIILKSYIDYRQDHAGNYVDYNLYSSLDDENWTLLGSGRLIDYYDPIAYYDFTDFSARYLRYDVVGGTAWAHLYELAAFDIPEPCTLVLLTICGLLIRKR